MVNRPPEPMDIHPPLLVAVLLQYDRSDAVRIGSRRPLPGHRAHARGHRRPAPVPQGLVCPRQSLSEFATEQELGSLERIQQPISITDFSWWQDGAEKCPKE